MKTVHGSREKEAPSLPSDFPGKYGDRPDALYLGDKLTAKPFNMNVLVELKRRKVYQVAAIYAAVARGLLQAADIIFPRLCLPDWSVTFLFALEVVGFPLALILSWIFDFKHGGVVRTGSQPLRSGPARILLKVVDHDPDAVIHAISD